MHDRHLTGTFLTGITVILVCGCSSVPELPAEIPGHTLQQPSGGTEQTRQIAVVDPQLDHFIAWIPRDRARTASVAEALAQVEWGNAKEQVGMELCAGSWLMNGEVTGRSGPFPATAPPELGGYPAWYYRVSHKPGFSGCEHRGSDVLYKELRANLPPWILLLRTKPRAGTGNGELSTALRHH